MTTIEQVKEALSPFRRYGTLPEEQVVLDNNLETAKMLILEYVRTYKGTTFAELEDLLDSFKIIKKSSPDDPKPVIGMSHSKLNNIVLWMNRNHHLADAVEQLVSEKKLFYHSGNVLIYIMDGKSLSLPVARNRTSYKELHWLPLTLNTFPRKNKK